jgi:hypothetical protein
VATVEHGREGRREWFTEWKEEHEKENEESTQQEKEFVLQVPHTMRRGKMNAYLKTCNQRERAWKAVDSAYLGE